jgi:hexosaminidase
MTGLNPVLLPNPRQLTLTGGTISLPENGFIVASAEYFFNARRLQSALHASAIKWQVAAAILSNAPFIALHHEPQAHGEGYRLSIRADAQPMILIEGDAAGIFYGVATLAQLVRQYGATIPCLTIEDYPDFPARGVMLDISRDKVPTLATIKDLVDRLANFKINQVQLYMEHTFAYSDHLEVWEHASPFTHEDILELDAFCKERHVDLVPNQNSLGHMERWLKFPRYNGLAECPDGFDAPWSIEWRSASTLDPLDRGSLDLITSLYDELLPHFSSKLFNIGGDEPWELGKGKSKEAVEQRGGRVYLDFILALYKAATERGRQVQFWGDIIIHHPELIPELPKDLIAMEWGYEAVHPFAEHSALFAQSGIPFYVCPGTSSWNSLVGRTDNTIATIRVAAENGLKNGAIGLLNTDWGDNGHFQPLSSSFLGFAYGAAASWYLAGNQDITPAALDWFVFEDSAGIMGKLVYDLGNIYHLIGPDHINGQVAAYALQWSQEKSTPMLNRYKAWGRGEANLTPDNLRNMIARIDEILQPIVHAQMQRPDAALIKDEFVQAARLLQHGTRWLLVLQGDEDHDPADLKAELQGLTQSQQTVWLARNRPGGLADSIERFNILLDEYKRIGG